MIKPLIASVVGNTDEAHWGQTFSTPVAYGLVEVHDSGGNARASGIRALTRLTQRFSELTVSLQVLVQLAESVYGGAVVTVIVLVPVGKIVYLVSRGRSVVYLKRGNQLSRLAAGDAALSGELQEHDTLLLASAGFVDALSETELTQAFDHMPPEDIAEKLTLLLHTKTDGAGGAALLFQAEMVGAIEQEAGVPAVRVVATPLPVAPGVRFPLTSFRRTIVPVLRHIRHKLPMLSLGRRPLVVAATVALLLLFAVSVVLGIQKQRITSRSQSVAKTLEQARYAFDEGVALLDLNPVKGRERLNAAKALVEPLTRSVPPRSADGRQVANLYGKITDNLTLAMHSVTQEPQLFFDMSLLKKGAQVTGFALDGDTLGVVDAPGKTVYTVTVSSKNGQIVAGGDTVSAALRIALHGDNAYVLTNDGIDRVSVTDKKTTPNVVKKDSLWGTIGSLVSFAGNLYLLDTQKSRVWKYVSGDTGFSELHEYLNPDTLPDFSQATGMAIDGSVWIGTNTGKIMRFTQGRENTLLVSGVDPALGNTLVVYVSDAATNAYILDSQNKRVVVLDKDGAYVAQYVWKGNIIPTQMVVSEAAKKILLLADGKIYAIELK